MSARRRSFWGWGWADRGLGRAKIADLGRQVGGVLGVDLGDPPPPPSIERLVLPRPRSRPPDSLDGFARATTFERASHTYGRAFPDLVRGRSGDFAPAPDFVVTPRDEDDLARTLEWASAAKVAVVPFGGGTSVVGGVEFDGDGYGGVVSLDTRALNRVVEVDTVSRAARIQAGATGPELERQLAAHDLTLRHYPQSFEFSTLGGWIATRSGGHWATGPTRIDAFVESLRMITPAGAWQSRRLPATGAGPAPDGLAIGSEGMLGVITEAWVRVQPRPGFRASSTVRFDRFEQGVLAVRAISQSGLQPSNCRLLDAREALLHRVSADGCAILLLAFESADHALGPWIERAIAICADSGGRSDGARLAEGDDEKVEAGADQAWRRAFFQAPYLQTALVGLGVVVDTFESACTWDRWERVKEHVTAAVEEQLRESCGGGLLTCRFSHVYPDGPAPYWTFLAPGRRGAEIEQWSAIKSAASEALVEAGATITHHHAVGRVHRPWYDRERADLFARTLRAAKGAVDPAGIMNPGVLVDP